jgi:malate dehydrogenase
VRSIWQPTPEGDNAALAVPSKGEYGVPEGLQFSFPVRSTGDAWSVIEGFEHDDFAKEKIRATAEELVEEREAVKDLLPS